MTIEDFEEILRGNDLYTILHNHKLTEAEALYYLYENGFLEYGIDDKLPQEEMGIISSD